MTYQCPACKRSFNEPGFCPYDGKQLVQLEVAQKPTVVSEFMAAQSGPYTLSDPDTMPPAGTQPGPFEDSTKKIRAHSAQDGGTTNVLALVRAAENSEYDRLVGETLDGRYFVQRKIGEGGMGVVYAAKHAVIERPLAIKVLKREVMRDTAIIKRFVQEAKAASRIGHPNIVDVTDFGTTPDGMTYSVMEYVDGKTLTVEIKHQAPFPPERSIRIAIQIARALGAAHDKGIVHRDLKPENVFLIDRDERPDFVKIVDFGIAKVQPLEGAEAGPRLTRVGSVFGTPEYMAPEQAAGRSDTDNRVDIYALGTILYEMTVGRTPFKSESMVRTIAMQMLDPIVPPRQVHPDLDVDPALEAVIMKALEKKREDRYATMGDMIIALEDAANTIRNSATHSLPPLPPGADPTLTPAPGVAVRSSDAPTNVGAPRRAKPETRQLHEPQFVAQGLVSLPQNFEEPDEPEPRRSRWPMILLALVVAGAGGAGVWYMLRPPQAVVATERHDAMIPGDTPLIVEVHDAGEPGDADVVTELSPDGGARVVRRDGGVAGPHDPRIITIEILTRPGDADVFVGHTFRGPSSVKLAEPYGTKLTITCKAPHYRGTITVVFDGTRDSVLCNAQRLKMCVPGLHNPYDNCEESSTP